MEPFSAVLLAGGQSSRMGFDKALLTIDGEPLWERQIEILARLQPNELFIAGPRRDFAGATKVHFLSDAAPNAGPLGGLVAALRACTTSRLLALAIDLPAMTTAFLQLLLDLSREDVGVVATRGHRFEPLGAIYTKGCLAAAEAALAAGQLSLQELCATWRDSGSLFCYSLAPEHEHLFANVNTPEEFTAFTRHHV